MTRNEFIANAVSRRWGMSDYGDRFHFLREVIQDADALEATNCAPWQTPPAPALTSAAMRVVETGIAWERDPGSLDLTQAHIAAVRAYKESAK